MGVLALFVIAIMYGKPMMPKAQSHTATITIGTSTVTAEVADTDAERRQGLSGRTGLAPGAGLLFVFEKEGDWGFWMKDMKFPIDILWADAEGTIVTITPNLSPQTYPQTYYPTKPAKYVLEVPAGWSGEHGVVEGARMVVQ